MRGLSTGALLLLARPALAGPGDVFGLGGRSMARGGGGVAFAEGAEAAWLNPAALGAQEHNAFFVSYTALRASFEPLPPVRWDTNVDGTIDDADEPLQLGTPGGSYDGITVGFRSGVGDRVGFGLVAFLPQGHLIRISSMEPALPDYFLYNRRLQTFDLAAGLGVHVLRGLSVGLGVQVGADVDVVMVGQLGVTIEGAEEEDEDVAQLVQSTSFDLQTVDLDVKPKLVPVAGLTWDLGELAPPLDGLSLGATWRGSGGIPIDILVDLQVDATVADMGELDPITLALLADLKLSFLDHAMPSRWTVGGAYALPRLGLVTADVVGTGWSGVLPSVAQVDEAESTLRSPLFQSEDPSVSDGNPYSLELRDTIGARVGIEISPLDREVEGRLAHVRLAARGGFAYEPSPLVHQGAGTAFLDADRIVVTGGLGFEHGDPFALLDGPLSCDLYVQGHLLASGGLDPSDDDPYRPGAPVDGAVIPIGGQLWAAGLQWSLAY